ncbi:MAG: hypothetical protein ACRED8_14255 [Caulobacteraceae bacterium]
MTNVPIAGSPLSNIVTSAVFPSASTCTAQTSPAALNEPCSTTDANGNVTTYAYDNTTGFLASVTPPKPTFSSNQPQTRYAYASAYALYKNSSGAIVQAASPVTLLSSTSACQTEAPSACPGTADDVKTTIAYQAGSASAASNLLPISTTAGAGDGSLEATSSQTFDQYGNVATTTGPLGSAQTTAYFWDPNRNQVGVIGPLPAGHTLYPAIQTTYGGDNQPTLVAMGTTTSQTSMASFNSLEQEGLGYDSLGRLSQVAESASGTTNSLVQYAYDNANRLTCTAVRMNPPRPASWGRRVRRAQTASPFAPTTRPMS